MRVLALGGERLILLIVAGVMAAGCAGGSRVVESPTSSGAPISSDVADSTTSTIFAEDVSGELVLLGFDDFDSPESELFWTGRDELLSSEVVGGALEVHAVDVSATQTLRSTWPPLSAVTIESDIANSGHSLGLFTSGCWSGENSYQVLWTGDRGLAVIARSGTDPLSEAATSSPIQVLSELGRSSLVGAVGVPFRLRVSCYVEGGVGWLSSSIDGEPVALVELPGDVGRFDAVGYTIAVAFEEAGLVIDNVAISEGYPAGISYPSILPAVADNSEPTVFVHDGLSFEFPDSWEYFTESLPFAELPETWGFAVSPNGVSTVISVVSFTYESFAELGMTDTEFATEFIPEYVDAQLSGGVTLRSDPATVRVDDEDAIWLQFEGIVGDETGKPLVADQVWVFTDSGGYMLFFRAPADDEAQLRPVWERTLATLELPDQ